MERAEIYANIERHTDHIPHLVDSLCSQSDRLAAYSRKHNHTTLSYRHRLIRGIGATSSKPEAGGFGLELWVQD